MDDGHPEMAVIVNMFLNRLRIRLYRGQPVKHLRYVRQKEASPGRDTVTVNDTGPSPHSLSHTLCLSSGCVEWISGHVWHSITDVFTPRDVIDTHSTDSEQHRAFPRLKAGLWRLRTSCGVLGFRGNAGSWELLVLPLVPW